MALQHYFRYRISSHVGGPTTEIPFNQPFAGTAVPADLAGDSVIRTFLAARYSIQLNDVGFNPHPTWPYRFQVMLGASVEKISGGSLTDFRGANDPNRVLMDQMELESVFQTTTTAAWGTQGWGASFASRGIIQSHGQRSDPTFDQHAVQPVVQPFFIDSSDWFPFGTSSYAWTWQMFCGVLFGRHL